MANYITQVKSHRMNKRKFTTHIASRKPVPIEMELQESAIELPTDYDQADLEFKKAKAIGICSLAQGKILSCDMEGDNRQWIRLEFEDETFLEWLNQTASTLIAALPDPESSPPRPRPPRPHCHCAKHSFSVAFAKTTKAKKK